MAIKRRGIVATPGTYKYGENTEVKTAKELREAAERQPIIMLTKGHPVDGMPSARDVIGTVSQKWNEQKQRVDGEFWFHDENTPDNIRENIVNMHPVSISPGFMIDRIGEHGEQEGIVYTHLAILDDEDPRCPLGTCGVNIRMDSKDGPRMARFDQKTDLEPPAEPAKKEGTPVAEHKPEPPSSTKEEAPLVAKEPVVDTAEVTAEPEPAVHKPEVAEQEQEEVPREPEVVIPASTTSRDNSGIVMVDGRYEYIPKLYRTNNNKEER